MFDFNSETGKADFKIVAKIPKEYQLVTTIPQTESIDGTMRTVTGKTQIRTQALALFYDKDWKKTSKNFGSLRFDIFAVEGFSPTVESMQDEFQKIYQKLESKFGRPAADYFSVVQSRARTPGWKFLTNQTVTAGIFGAKIVSDTPNIRAPFAHEISHAWTDPTGKGTNFLREGWASFVESYFIRETFGAETENAYFTNYRRFYNEGGFEGKQSILEDADNNGISYYKGAWIFKMLRDFIGEESFEKGMKKYISDSGNGKATINDFIAAFADTTKKDVGTFLKPWIEGQNLPNISAELLNNKLEINQKGLVFLLPLEVEFETISGKTRKTFLISKSTEVFDLKEIGNVKTFHLDPDNQLLLKSQTQ